MGERKIEEETGDLVDFYPVTPGGNLNFVFMVILKDSEEEKDELEHCPEYVKKCLKNIRIC